ncbi:MAG: hypothetical protein JO282_13095 [Alphaproteobacteria bacterium]|nr:hypothetical protein [Alphaproteobacteria bacterium]
MATRFKVLAVAAALAAGTSSGAMAQYYCAPGYTYYNGVCRPVPAHGYPSNPVSGEEAEAESGAATGGPVGAVIGGALGTATGAVAGTANALAGVPPAPVCSPGYTYIACPAAPYNGYCYPAR